MRQSKSSTSTNITEETAVKLYAALERKYPGKVWRTVEVCPVAVVKTIDNEDDALETIRRIEASEARCEFCKASYAVVVGYLDGKGACNICIVIESPLKRY